MITEPQILEFLDEFQAAQRSQKFANVAALIHPDALFRFNDGDYRGIAEIQQAFEKTWAYDIEDERYETSGVEVMSRDSDSAVVTFAFRWSGKNAENGAFQIDGRGTSAIVRHEGRLKIKVEHLSP